VTSSLSGQHALREAELRRRGREMVVANIRDDHIHSRASRALAMPVDSACPDECSLPGRSCIVFPHRLNECAGAANKALDKPPQSYCSKHTVRRWQNATDRKGEQWSRKYPGRSPGKRHSVRI